jgi:ketosteroid isomerase-like protein
MSQENVALARKAFEAYADGDMDRAFALVDPEIVWIVAEEHPDARTLRGWEAIVAYRREWEEMLMGMRLVNDRIVDAGESVVLIGRVTGVGVGSGAGLEVPLALVETFEDGRIVRVQEYLDPAAALEACGVTD